MLMNVLVLTEPPARRSTLYFIQEEAASVGMFCKATPNSGRMTTSGSLTTLKLKSERSLRTALGIPTARVGLYISANTQSRAAPQKLFSPGISQTLGQGLREGETRGLMSGSGGNLCSNWRAENCRWGRWRMNPSCTIPARLWHTSCDTQWLPRIGNNGWESGLMSSYYVPVPFTWFTENHEVNALRISLQVGGVHKLHQTLM